MNKPLTTDEIVQAAKGVDTLTNNIAIELVHELQGLVVDKAVIKRILTGVFRAAGYPNSVGLAFLTVMHYMDKTEGVKNESE